MNMAETVSLGFGCMRHLPIRDHLEQVAKKFESGGFFPTRVNQAKA